MKKKIELFTGTFLLLLLTIAIVPTQQSCYFDNEAELYPDTTCDTTDIKYSVEIKNILVKDCLSCHTGTGGNAGIALENYDFLKKYATGGQFVDRITNAASPMPPDGLINECDREKIKAWVNSGAKNN